MWVRALAFPQAEHASRLLLGSATQTSSSESVAEVLLALCTAYLERNGSATCPNPQRESTEVDDSRSGAHHDNAPKGFASMRCEGGGNLDVDSHGLPSSSLPEGLERVRSDKAFERILRGMTSLSVMVQPAALQCWLHQLLRHLTEACIELALRFEFPAPL